MNKNNGEKSETGAEDDLVLDKNKDSASNLSELPTGASDHVYVPDPDHDPRFAVGANTYNENCKNCHGSFSEVEKFSDEVTREKTTSDLIMKAIVNVDNMNYLSTIIGKEDADVIAFALNYVYEGFEEEVASSVTYTNPYATGMYVHDVLVDLFATTSDVNLNEAHIDRLEQEVLHNETVFGGVSNAFNGVRRKNSEANEKSMLPSFNLRLIGVKEGLCADLVSSDVAIDSALSKVNLTHRSEINDFTLKVLYRYIFTDPNPNETVLESLELATESLTSTREAWRLVLYLLCRHPKMEAL